MAMAAPRVTFYVLPDADDAARLNFACRLVEKAYQQDHRVVVRCDTPEDARAFDELLWRFGDGSFVPHDLAGTGDGADTPVLIASGDAPPTGALLVNLGTDLPAAWERYERLAEVIDGDAERRRLGRDRFRHYREHGVVPETHEVGVAS